MIFSIELMNSDFLINITVQVDKKKISLQKMLLIVHVCIGAS